MSDFVILTRQSLNILLDCELLKHPKLYKDQLWLVRAVKTNTNQKQKQTGRQLSVCFASEMANEAGFYLASLHLLLGAYLSTHLCAFSQQHRMMQRLNHHSHHLK